VAAVRRAHFLTRASRPITGLALKSLNRTIQRMGGSQSLGFRVFVGGFCVGYYLKSGLLDDLHHVISMGLPGPKDLVRHGCRKSRTPFKLALRSPFSVSQIHTSGSWIKPPSSGGCFVHDNWAFWTSERRHQRMLPFWRLHSNGGTTPDLAGPGLEPVIPSQHLRWIRTTRAMPNDSYSRAAVVERAGSAKIAHLIGTETRDGRRNPILVGPHL
jgi:hypothetical protein